MNLTTKDTTIATALLITVLDTFSVRIEIEGAAPVVSTGPTYRDPFEGLILVPVRYGSLARDIPFDVALLATEPVNITIIKEHAHA